MVLILVIMLMYGVCHGPVLEASLPYGHPAGAIHLYHVGGALTALHYHT